MNKPVYLDYNATTPVAAEVLEAMLPYLVEHYGNPSSSHPYGGKAAEAVRDARESVARLLGAAADEIVFTGSATEANNLALFGVARALAGAKRHLVVSGVLAAMGFDAHRALGAVRLSVGWMTTPEEIEAAAAALAEGANGLLVRRG